MEDCTESHQIWNDTLGKQSRNQVGTTVPAAMGPCAPSEPVLHSSGFVVTSEHAATSGCFETRVDCAASHGFDMSPAHLAWSQPLVGTQSAQVGHLGVEPMSVISGFYAESSAVSHGFDVALSGGTCGKDTSPAHLARSQPDVSTQCAHVGYPGVDLVSRVTYISRKKRNLETVQRHSKALKKTQRDAKRKFVAQPEISHEAAEIILRNQATRTDEKFPGTIHVSHHLALLHGHENVFFRTQCGAVNADGALRLLKSQCDGSGESRQKARRKLERGLMPNEHRCKARILVCAVFPLMLLDFHRAPSMSLAIKKSFLQNRHESRTATCFRVACTTDLARRPFCQRRPHSTVLRKIVAL